MKLLSLFSIVAMLLLTSCSSDQGMTNITVYYDIDKDAARYYVSKSPSDVGENSVSNQIYEEISKYAIAKRSNGPESLSEAFLNAKANDSNYVIYPKVSLWTRIDEPGKPFEADIKFEIDVYAVSSENLVNKSILSRECIFATPLGRPDDCVSLDLWADRLIKK